MPERKRIRKTREGGRGRGTGSKRPAAAPPNEVLAGSVTAVAADGKSYQIDVSGFVADPMHMNGKQSIRYAFKPPNGASDRLPRGYTHVMRIRQKRAPMSSALFELHNKQPKTKCSRRRSSVAKSKRDTLTVAPVASDAHRAKGGSSLDTFVNKHGELAAKASSYTPATLGVLSDLVGTSA